MAFDLFDHPRFHTGLKPLTLTRRIGQIRCGILTLEDKWGYYLTHHVSDDHLWVNATVLPDTKIVEAILSLHRGQSLFFKHQLVAQNNTILNMDAVLVPTDIQYDAVLTWLARPHDIFVQNEPQIQEDFKLLTAKKNSELITDPHTRIYGKIGTDIFISSGLNVKSAVLDASKGPIFFGNNVTVSPNAVIQGPVAILDDSCVAIGAKIRENTTIGPGCNIGGEVKNTVFLGNSNKAHEGYLGNSVIGEWCNFGADTNGSNMKNNYNTVKSYSYSDEAMTSTGLTFCGLVMGDHSKCGINTMFNTGTVVGVGCHIFGGGFVDKFIPSFVWGGHQKSSQAYRFDAFLTTAHAVMARRGRVLTQQDIAQLKTIFQQTTARREAFLER